MNRDFTAFSGSGRRKLRRPKTIAPRYVVLMVGEMTPPEKTMLVDACGCLLRLASLGRTLQEGTEEKHFKPRKNANHAKFSTGHGSLSAECKV